MNICPGAGPAFLSHNYLNRHAYNASDIIVSSGDATKHRLFDMVPSSRWQSAGSSDVVTETIEFGLWRPGARMSHDVVHIMVMNHNIEGLVVEHSNTNGAPWTTGYSKTDLAEKNTRITLAATAMDRIKVSMTTTQTADAEKAIGDIIVAGAAFQPGELFEYKVEPRRMQHKTAQMADGSLRGNLIWRADDSASFWAAKCGWIMDPADYDDSDAFDEAIESFRDYGIRGRQFLFLPQPGDRPEEVYLCRVRPGTFNDTYIKPSEAEGGMRGVQMVIEEIGGA